MNISEKNLQIILISGFVFLILCLIVMSIFIAKLYKRVYVVETKVKDLQIIYAKLIKSIKRVRFAPTTTGTSNETYTSNDYQASFQESIENLE